MAIHALPESSTLRLSAGQVLLDTVSIIKELVENSIDACANSIFIETSGNTVDSILVRDNGQGVHPDDRGMIGKRYCTSKIRNFNDLIAIGGTSFGFRGEALNSLVLISKDLTVTTKIDGEMMGVCVNIIKDRPNHLKSVCHTVGTTVKASNMFHGMPIRRQVAINTSTKTIKRVHKLLHSYILSHPEISFRFSYKGNQSISKNLSYVPNPKKFSVRDAALQLFSRDCVNECEWHTRNISEFTFEALIPRFKCDISKISGQEQHLSLDGRPVLHNRGTLRQIYNIFVNDLRNHHADGKHIKEPFIRLNIVCPLETYDINIEPAKNDVLFVDSETLKVAAKVFFGDLYKVSDSKESLHLDSEDTLLPSSSAPTLVERSKQAAQDLSLSKTKHTISTLSSQSTDESITRLMSSGDNDRAAILESMGCIDDNNLLRMNAVSNSNQNVNSKSPQMVSRDVQLSNPWVFTKMALKTGTHHEQPETELVQETDLVSPSGDAEMRIAKTMQRTLPVLNGNILCLKSISQHSQDAGTDMALASGSRNVITGNILPVRADKKTKQTHLKPFKPPSKQKIQHYGLNSRTLSPIRTQQFQDKLEDHRVIVKKPRLFNCRPRALTAPEEMEMIAPINPIPTPNHTPHSSPHFTYPTIPTLPTNILSRSKAVSPGPSELLLPTEKPHPPRPSHPILAIAPTPHPHCQSHPLRPDITTMFYTGTIGTVARVRVAVHEMAAAAAGAGIDLTNPTDPTDPTDIRNTWSTWNLQAARATNDQVLVSPNTAHEAACRSLATRVAQRGTAQQELAERLERMLRERGMVGKVGTVEMWVEALRRCVRVC